MEGVYSKSLWTLVDLLKVKLLSLDSKPCSCLWLLSVLSAHQIRESSSSSLLTVSPKFLYHSVSSSDMPSHSFLTLISRTSFHPQTPIMQDKSFPKPSSAFLGCGVWELIWARPPPRKESILKCSPRGWLAHQWVWAPPTTLVSWGPAKDLGFVSHYILLFPPSAVLMDSPQHAHSSPGLFVWCGDTLSDPVPTCCSNDLGLIPKSMFQPRCATYHSSNKPTAFSLSYLFTLLRQFSLHRISPITLCLVSSFPQEAPWISSDWNWKAFSTLGAHSALSLCSRSTLLCFCFVLIFMLILLACLSKEELYLVYSVSLSGIVNRSRLEWTPVWWPDSCKHNRKTMLKKALTSIGGNWTLVHLLQKSNLETREMVSVCNVQAWGTELDTQRTCENLDRRACTQDLCTGGRDGTIPWTW